MSVTARQNIVPSPKRISTASAAAWRRLDGEGNHGPRTVHRVSSHFYQVVGFNLYPAQVAYRIRGIR